MRWLDNTDGKPDAMLTAMVYQLVFIAAVAVAVLVLLVMGTMTPEMVGAYADIIGTLAGFSITASTAGYGFRRYTDRRYTPPSEV